jgi:hypothetical protein
MYWCIFFVKALFLRTFLYDHNGVFQVDKSLGGFAVNDQFEAGFPDGISFFPPEFAYFETQFRSGIRI